MDKIMGLINPPDKQALTRGEWLVLSGVIVVRIRCKSS